MLFKLSDVYELKLAKFMHKLFNNQLPCLFQYRFSQLENIHSYEWDGKPTK